MSDINATLMISMPVTEFKKMLNESVREVLKDEFSPLRRQFEDRLIPLHEAQKKIGVSRTTMFHLEKRGELIPTRIGAKVMYRESAITQYLSKKR